MINQATGRTVCRNTDRMMSPMQASSSLAAVSKMYWDSIMMFPDNFYCLPPKIPQRRRSASRGGFGEEPFQTCEASFDLVLVGKPRAMWNQKRERIANYSQQQ